VNADRGKTGGRGGWENWLVKGRPGPLERNNARVLADDGDRNSVVALSAGRGDGGRGDGGTGGDGPVIRLHAICWTGGVSGRSERRLSLAAYTLICGSLRLLLASFGLDRDRARQ